MNLWSKGLARSREKLIINYIYINTAPAATTLGKVVTHLKRPLPINHMTLEWHILQDHVTNLKNFISTTTAPIANKFGRIMSYFERLLAIKSYDLDHVAFQNHVTKYKNYITTTTLSMAYKLGKWWFTLRGSFLNESLVTWFCEINWQSKIILSPLPQCFWTPNMAGW